MRLMKSKKWLVFAAVLLITSRVWGQYKLTLSVSGMGPHIGQTFLVRVVDEGNLEEVGRSVLTSIPGASFDVELYVLILGHSYTVDFFVDFNGNGQYDAPPADYAWRLTLTNAQGDEILNFAYNTNFTDIGWDSEFNISDYAGIWTGYWINATFGSSEPIDASVEVIPDSQKVRVTSTSSNILGNSAVETKVGVGFYNTGQDSVVVNAPSPWTGTAVVRHGEFAGSGTAPEFGGTNIEIKGNFGPSQMITAFFISGPFDAQGIVVTTKQETPVEDHLLADLPAACQLHPNYPNPFNPRTTIRYDVIRPGFVSLKMYSLLGKELVTLVGENMGPGEYTVEWDATGMPSGFYICRFAAGNHVETRKVILQR